MEGETPANKLHTKIEIKPQGQEPEPSSSSSFDNPENNNQPEGTFPLFESRYCQRASDTWLIYLILHLLAFITTTLFSYFPLGRVFFQPLSENPLLGPSASTIDKVGALRREFLAQNHQTCRFFVCPWLHAGFIHFAINISCMIFVGIHLERDYGPNHEEHFRVTETSSLPFHQYFTSKDNRYADELERSTNSNMDSIESNDLIG